MAEIYVVVAHKQVVVFEAKRPTRGEGVFDADADRCTPASFPRSVDPNERR